MSLEYWRLTCLLSLALFVFIIFINWVLRLTKNKYYNKFTADELFKKKSTPNSRNYVYFTSGITRKYIKKYVICKTVYDKYLVCNFSNPYDKIEYFVIQYNRRKRPISVAKINETNTRDTSKVIALKNRCKYVNVIVGTVNDFVINDDVIRPLSVRRIRLHSFLRCFKLYTFLFVVRHILVEVILRNKATIFFNESINYILIGLPALLLFINYFITVGCFRRKNVKALSGGALEYEFI